MPKSWTILGLLAACLVGGGGHALAAAPAEPADIAEPPDDLHVLSLTDLQRRVLEQIFHRHDFETPPAPEADADFGVKVEPVAPGGLFVLGPDGDLPVRLTVTVRSTGPRAPVRVRYYAEDFYGRKVGDGSLPAVFPDSFGLATINLALSEITALGYYHVLVTATTDNRTAKAACGVAVVYPSNSTPDPKGLFGLTAPPGTLAADVPSIARRLGASHLAIDWPRLPLPAPALVEALWSDGEAALAAVRKTGLVPDGIVPIELPLTAVEPAIELQAKAEMVQHFASTVRDWRLGRWLVFGGDSLEQSATAYRGTIAGLLEAVRRTNAPTAVSVAASPEVLVDVLTEGPVLAGAEGVSLCLNADAAAPNLRSGAYRRSLDYAVQVARRIGIKHVVVGQTGDDPATAAPQQQAWKLVTRHVLALASGVERVYVSYGRGAPSPLPAAAAYAWMTHLLESAVYQRDLWPDVPLLEGHLFNGPERRVAVVWSWVGADPANPDSGAMVFDNGTGLEAWDVVGRSVGIWKGPRLIVPLGEAPVYIASGELTADQVRDRIREAKIFGIAPAAVWIRSVAPGDSPGRMNVTLWVQSQRPYRLDAIAGLLLPPPWRARQAKERFGLDPGQAREVTFDCEAPVAKGAEAPADAPRPPYEIQAAVSLNEEWVRHTQSVWPTVIPQRTIEVGGGLDDWEGVDPVVLASPSGDVQAVVRVAYDAKCFYFSAAVHRERNTYRAGAYVTDGDAVQLAWGLADRADDDFGEPGRDRGLPSGAFRDTDHLMALAFGKDGAQVIRLCGPHMTLRDHVPGNLDPWFGPVEGAEADIARDPEKQITYYEAAIPLAALAPLKAERGRAVRFGFRIGDGDGPPLEWSRAARVPDYLAGPGSFLPMSYAEGLPCQTVWTFAEKK